MDSRSNKRFWGDVTISTKPDGFEIRLDGRPLRIPDAGVLHVSNRVLAEAIASEWRDAGGGAIGASYEPDAVGLTRLAASMGFRVGPRRNAAVAHLLAFLDNELLCYRATHPAALVARQARDWQPWLDWCRDTLGATLLTTAGIMPVRQHQAAHAAIERALQAQDDAGLTALGVLAPALNSLVLALACVSGALSAADAHRLSMLDEHVQAEQWGVDAEALQRQQRLLGDCTEAERFLLLARTMADTLLLVEGRVQGVGFRAWLQNEASRLGLRGWVRNLADGRVEARLCGPEQARAALVRLAGDGPRMAAVHSVVAREEPADASAQETADFLIRSTARHQQSPGENGEVVA